MKNIRTNKKIILLISFIMILSNFSPLFSMEVKAADSDIKGIYGIVYFRTKGCGTNTYYKNAVTGKSGYTNGCYGADAAFLGYNHDATQVKFKMSGITGWVSAHDVGVKQYVDHSNWKDLYTSNYQTVNGVLKHNVMSDVFNELSGDSISLGPKPSFLANNAYYWSYDGHYFYPATRDGYINMINDYVNGSNNNSINNGNPYYNYYQYLTNRSISNYTPADVANYFRGKGIVSPMTSYPASKGQSLFYGEQTSFVQYQNEFGANIGLSIGVATNESANGTSNIAFNGNNLFGHSAFDSSPGASATSYLSVAQSIYAHDRFYVSEGYLDPCDGRNWAGAYDEGSCGKGRYNGGHVGDKQSGMNVKYASDPYWGDKAAQFYYLMDNALSMQDYNKYTIAVKEDASNVGIYKDPSTSSTLLYKSGSIENYPVIVLEETTGTSVNGNNKWYKVQTDPVLNGSRTSILQDSGYYNYNNNYGYVPAAYFRKTNNGAAVKNRYNITFDSVGGLYSDGTSGRKTITAEQNTIPEINAPTKEGDTFLGWSPAVMGATSDVTYTAQWKNNKYNVTFNASGGKFSDSNTSKVVVTPSNTKPTVDNPTRDGYTFKGWTPTIENATKETTYTAQWEKIAIYYDITFDAVGGNFVDGKSILVSKTEEGKIPAVKEPTKDGYIFTGWTPTLTEATATKTYKATYREVVKYDITFSANGGKFTDGKDTKVVSTIEGEIPAVEQPTKEDHIFVGWDKEITTATGIKVYTATWREGTIEDNLTNVNANFYFDYLKSVDGQLVLKGYNTISGIDNNLNNNIYYSLVFENLETGKVTRQEVERITNDSEITRPVPSGDGKDYKYSWFKGKIDLKQLPEGDYKIYILSYNDKLYSKSLINNRLYKEQATNYDGDKFVIVRNNYSGSMPQLEMIVRKEKLGAKTGSYTYNQFDQYRTFQFNSDKLLNILGTSYSYGADMQTSASVKRNIIFENSKTYEKYSYDVHSITDGLYNVILPVSDGLGKERAWYNAKIDLSNIPIGNYIMYISNITNISDIGEFRQALTANIDGVKTTINGKNYSFYVNKEKRNRIELNVK